MYLRCNTSPANFTCQNCHRHNTKILRSFAKLRCSFHEKETSVTSLNFWEAKHINELKKYTVLIGGIIVLFSSLQILLTGLYLDRCEVEKQRSLSTCKGASQSGEYISLKILPVHIVSVIFISKSLCMTGERFKKTVT